MVSQSVSVRILQSFMAECHKNHMKMQILECVSPGAGEPNFDALDANPYRSTKQRQEWEVKALLEKVQPELIGLDPGLLGKVDQVSFKQKHKERVEVLVSSALVTAQKKTCGENEVSWSVEMEPRIISRYSQLFYY